MEEKNQNKKTRQGRKGKRAPGRVLTAVLLTVFLVGVGVSVYQISTILLENRRADVAYLQLRAAAQYSPETTDAADPAEEETGNGEQETAPEAQRHRQQSVDMAALQAEYPDMVGWIFAEGTGIDYPVMQAKDNDYYLNRLYNGTQNANGSIFMDYRNNGIFVDDNTVIYGHNMQSGTMFHVLNEYKFQGFYDTHPTMVISTAEGDFLVELIAGTVEDGNYEFVRFAFDDFADMSAYVDEIVSRSAFVSGVELQPGDKLVTLCTCTYERQNARYMLLGRVTELYED